MVCCCCCSCPGVIYVGRLTLRETHRVIADSFALISSAIKPKSCTPVLEVNRYNPSISQQTAVPLYLTDIEEITDSVDRKAQTVFTDYPTQTLSRV